MVCFPKGLDGLPFQDASSQYWAQWWFCVAGGVRHCHQILPCVYMYICTCVYVYIHISIYMEMF